MGKIIRLSKSSVTSDDIKAVKKTLQKEYLGMGNEVFLFEKLIKKFLNTKKKVLCVSSASAALHLSLLSLNLKKDDEVIVPSISFVSALQSILAVGAKPVFCDINKKNGFMDIEDLKKKITKNTKVIMPVYYASDAPDIQEVYKIAKKKNLRVVEDAANAFGSYSGKKPVGSKGDIICFSFDGIKNITSGEGGAIVSSDKKVIAKIRSSRFLGISKEDANRYKNKKSFNYDVKLLGFRYHMSNICASLGISQLKRINIIKKKRQTLVENYIKKFKPCKHVEILDLNYKKILPHIFVIKVDSFIQKKLIKHLKNHNIETGIHWVPSHTFSIINSKAKLKNTQFFYNNVITLPLHNDLSASMQQRIIKLILTFLNALN